MKNPYLHAQGKTIVDKHGREVLLRGVGLGGWLLPEGYMWKFPQAGDRPRKIEGWFIKCIGEEDASRFWDAFYRHFITHADIKAIAKLGYNSIRIPLHWRFLLDQDNKVDENHWSILDDVIGWCEKEKVYVILDLHGAPGGQTGANIDDSEHDFPELFTHTEHQELTIQLWESLVRRYKDKEIIACYDLLNEPLPNPFSQYHDDLVSLYKRLIDRIRALDPYHMISLEGSHWATDWSIFTQKWDDNVLYHFHKYWNHPDQRSIQRFLDKREIWNVPIFMGEGGENNKEWYTGTFGMLDDLKISWNFWTYKKMETTNSPYSVKMPKGWVDFAQEMEAGIVSEKSKAMKILWEYLENVKIENCVPHPEVSDALFRRPDILFPAVFYAHDENAKINVSNRSNIGFRIEDHREIGFVESDLDSPNFSHGQGQTWKEDEWLYVGVQSGDSIRYHLNSPKKQSIWLGLDLMVEDTASITVKIGLQTIQTTLATSSRSSHSLGKFLLIEGLNPIQLSVDQGKIKLISLQAIRVE